MGYCMEKEDDRKAESMAGIIFGIQHFSIHDGPGIRSTVFMKGCPLRCLWCHNPESVSNQPVLSYTPDKCVGCGGCFGVCPNSAHKMAEGLHLLSRENCKGCGLCVNGCIGKALELIGRKATVDEIILDLLKDRTYYETSGGGITLSGGEPMLQPEFTSMLLKRAKEEGLHCAVETSGFCHYSLFERVLPMVDLFLFDFKETDPKRHKEFTGVSNELILNNLEKLYRSGAGILLRCPVVPGLNDREEHFARIAEITKMYEQLIGAELLAYHRLGVSKTDRFGMDTRHVFEEPDQATVSKWRDMVREHGGRVFES